MSKYSKSSRLKYVVPQNKTKELTLKERCKVRAKGQKPKINLLKLLNSFSAKLME
jgi:hypothetical protein